MRAHEHDHRIGRGVDRRLAAVAQADAKRDIQQAGAVDQLGRAFARRFAAQDLLDERIVGPERLAQLAERERQQDLLQLGIDRRGRLERPQRGRKVDAGEIVEPLLVGLGHLGGVAHQGAGNAQKLRAQTLPARGEPVAVAPAAVLLDDGAVVVPRRAILRPQLRVGGDLVAQLPLRRDARPDDRRVDQRLELALGALERVLQAVQQSVGDARLFGAARSRTR